MTDLHSAVRALRAKPLITSVAMLSLALGIGATTAIFSIVDALVLRALPVTDPERLTLLTGDGTWAGSAWSNPVWEAVRDRPDLHDGAFAFNSTGFNVAERGVVDPVAGLQASGGMFDVLGVNAQVGRTFTAIDDRRDGGPDGPVAVLSDGFWRRRYGAAADVIGRSITLNRVSFTIVGVARAGFFGPEVGRAFDVAVPLSSVALLNGDAGPLDSRTSWWLRVMIRLPSDRPIEREVTALRAAQAAIREQTRPVDQRAQDAAAYLARPFDLIPAVTGGSELRGIYQRPVIALLVIVVLTLLVACGNVANLLLARSVARRHELSVRTALGASGRRLAVQLFTESLFLAAAGAALGVAIALWGSRLILDQIAAPGSGIFLDIGLQARMLGFTGALAIGTALLFGTIPALRAARVAPIEAMRDAGRGTTSGRRGLADGLVVVQVALSLVLLVGAGLFVRSFGALVTRDLGFDSSPVLLVHMGAPGSGIPIAERMPLYERILESVSAVPGVSKAALSMITPVAGSNSTRFMEFPDGPELPEAERRVWMNVVTPGWFDALGIPVSSGRDFDARDDLDAPRAVIVNRAFARKYFGDRNPLGATVAESPTPFSDPRPLEIVGVVSDAVYRSVREPVPPTMYWALAQQSRPPGGMSVVARARGTSPGSLARALTDAIGAVQPDLTLVIRPLSDQIDITLARERTLALLSAFFGGLALLLAALGLYGVTAYAVSRRSMELGIRMALGATPTRTLGIVMRRVVLLVGGGLAIGGVAAWWASAWVGSLLYGLGPRDPSTLLAALSVLLGVGMLAGLLPAVRGARLDASAVLRGG